MDFFLMWIWYGVARAVFAVTRIAIAVVRKVRAIEAEKTLCLTCVSAVVTRGTSGRTWIACNYGAALRPVNFAVSECTGFCGRGAAVKLVTIEGFAPEKRKVYAEVAIPSSACVEPTNANFR